MRPRRLSVPLIIALLALAGCSGGSELPPGDGSEAGEEVGAAVPPVEEATAERLHVLDLDPARPETRGLDSALIAEALARADSLPRLRCLLIARHGEVLVERCADGYRPDRYANVKSVSKSVLSALVGIAVEEGHLEGPDQRVVPFFNEDLDTIADPAKERITIGHLLSMQSGLERTSGRNYGAWVSGRDWVGDAIRRPMVAEPGGRMLYSTGNYHLLSSILTEATGVSTAEYARSRLADPLDIRIPPWIRDPRGIYFGGNDMRLSPLGMLWFGELYRNEGRVDGEQVVPEGWVRTSLEPRTRSPWSGERYGYGWFLGRAGQWPMFYAWGYGGQFIFIVPDLELTVVTTSDPAAPRGGGHLDRVHRLLDQWIVPAAEQGAESG